MVRIRKRATASSRAARHAVATSSGVARRRTRPSSAASRESSESVSGASFSKALGDRSDVGGEADLLVVLRRIEDPSSRLDRQGIVAGDVVHERDQPLGVAPVGRLPGAGARAGAALSEERHEQQRAAPRYEIENQFHLRE